MKYILDDAKLGHHEFDTPQQAGEQMDSAVGMLFALMRVSGDTEFYNEFTGNRYRIVEDDE